MTRNKMITGMAVLMLAALACNKEEAAVVRTEKEAAVRFPVTISIGVEGATKVSGEGASEDKVNKVYAYAFRTDGSLDAEGSAEAGSLSLDCTSAAKTFAVLVNGKGDKPVMKSLSVFRGYVSDLSDNIPASSFVMSGQASPSSVSPGAKIGISAKRLVGKVTVSEVKAAFTSSTYQKMLTEDKIKVTGMYLRNVATRARLDWSVAGDPALAYKNGHESANAAYDPLCYESLNTSLSAISPGAHTFYFYPNSDASNATRFILEVTFDGKKTYYPIKIADQVKANTHYKITRLTITRAGSDSPSTDVSTGTYTCEVSVAPWEDGGSTTPTI